MPLTIEPSIQREITPASNVWTMRTGVYLPLSDCQQPFPIEYMMREKQGEHPHPKPLMRRLAHKTIGHQKQQRHGHCGIDYELDFLN